MVRLAAKMLLISRLIAVIYATLASKVPEFQFSLNGQGQGTAVLCLGNPLKMLPHAYILNAKADNIANFVYDELTKTSTIRDCMYINCKYYTASVQLKLVCGSYPKPNVRTAEALVICFDTENPESWSVACDWLKSREGEEDIPVQLLVCDSLSNKNLRMEVFAEATKNHFEIVQLSPPSDEIEEDEEYGVARIIAALIAHQWSNLVLKNRKTVTGESVARNHSQQKSNAVAPVEKSVNQKGDSDEGEGDDDSDGEVFNELFPKLMEMRCKGASMDLEGRRKMAEKMTVRFWRALKLDEEEIQGLLDDGED
uniref:Alpha and gamma adaptin binding protein n=2 Tax=Echinococcus granulosus TaxID=6210 RepID=A0A068WSX4_ECHGR|nr:alpha and gamma adaptin binding protein [Echinococcus granulosus]